MERVNTVYEIFTGLRYALEVGVRYPLTDRVALLSFAVEAINKLLYCYTISPTLYEAIDSALNDPFAAMKPTPHSVDEVYRRALTVTRECVVAMEVWRARAG